MNELFVAIGLVMVIEGALYALFPEALKRVMVLAAQSPDQTLRTGGTIAFAAGVLVVWLARA